MMETYTGPTRVRKSRRLPSTVVISRAMGDALAYIAAGIGEPYPGNALAGLTDDQLLRARTFAEALTVAIDSAARRQREEKAP